MSRHDFDLFVHFWEVGGRGSSCENSTINASGATCFGNVGKVGSSSVSWSREIIKDGSAGGLGFVESVLRRLVIFLLIFFLYFYWLEIRVLSFLEQIFDS